MIINMMANALLFKEHQDLIKNKSKKCFPSHGIMKSLEVACSVVAHDLKDTLSIHNTWTGVTTLLLSR